MPLANIETIAPDKDHKMISFIFQLLKGIANVYTAMEDQTDIQ